MSTKEIFGLHRITKKHLKDLCKEHKLYQTPHLNEQLYLHFQGFQLIENLEEYTGLKCLWLESNAISEIQGLECQSELKCLFLQNNLIRKIENLHCCSLLDTLNLSSNHITRIENCCSNILPMLSSLNLSKNYLQNCDSIHELVNCKNICSLDLSHNRLDDILVVKIFAKMPELRVLVLQGNPVVSKVPQYRKTLILECKNLTYLDSRPVFPKDRACAEAWKRGGYEEERKESNRWAKLDRKKIRDSVNATIRLRQKHGDGDIKLLESSDDENENKVKTTPENRTRDLELTGINPKTEENTTDLSDSSSMTSSDNMSQEKPAQININLDQNKNLEEITNKDNNIVFEENLIPELIVENIIDTVFSEEFKNKDEEIVVQRRETDFEILKDVSELKETKIQQENTEIPFGDSQLNIEESNVCRTEVEDMLQKATETLDKNDLPASDFFTNLGLKKTVMKSENQLENTHSQFDDIDGEIEEEEYLHQKPIEFSEENDASLSTFVSTDWNDTSETESSSSSSSSKSSFSDEISDRKKKTVLNEEHKLKDTYLEVQATERKEDFHNRIDNQLLLQKSLEDNKEDNTSFMSLSTSNSSDQTEKTKAVSSSSSLEFSSSDDSSSDDSCVNVKEIISNEKFELEIEPKSQEDDNIQDGIIKNKSVENMTDILSKVDESSRATGAVHNADCQNLNSSSLISIIPTEQESSDLMDNTEARLKDIFTMILTDENSDSDLASVSSGTVKRRTQIQQASDNNTSPEYLSSEYQNIDNFAEDELKSEQKIDETSTNSIWNDRNWHLEDKIASIWLENFLANECKNENSLAKEIVEELNDNGNGLALNDSWEWIEKNYGEESQIEHSEEMIEEFQATKKNCDSKEIIEKNTNKSEWLKFSGEEPVKSLNSNEKLFESMKDLKNNLDVHNEERSSNEENFDKIYLDWLKFTEETYLESYHHSSGNIQDKEQNSDVSKEERSSIDQIEDLKMDKEFSIQKAEENLQANDNKENTQNILFTKNVKLAKLIEQDSNTGTNTGTNTAEDGLLENNSESLSWWERNLALASMSKESPIANEVNKEESEKLKLDQERKVFEEERNDVLEVPILEDQADASNFLDNIFHMINDPEDEASTVENSFKESEDPSGNQLLDKSVIIQEEIENLETETSGSNPESSIKDTTSISTLREIVTSFNKVAETISSRKKPKSELFKELIASPLTKTFSGQSSDQINRQFEELRQQKREKLSNLVDYVYAQREKYDDTLEVVNGRLMVVKRSTGALEELPPPPSLSSHRTGSTKYISCGVSTITTSCNDVDNVNDNDIDEEDDKDDNDDGGGGGNSDEYVTALSSEEKDNDYDDDEADAEAKESDIEQHASDTKIKSIPYCNSSDVNYCANESVSLSSTGSSTELQQKQEVDNNHHHSDEVDDNDDDDNSQQRAASVSSGRLHNEIDSEVLPESSKCLEKEETALVASASPADYILPSQEGGLAGASGIQTSYEFQVELNDSIQSFMDFGEQPAALEDISLILKNPELDE